MGNETVIKLLRELVNGNWGMSCQENRFEGGRDVKVRCCECNKVYVQRIPPAYAFLAVYDVYRNLQEFAELLNEHWNLQHDPTGGEYAVSMRQA